MPSTILNFSSIPRGSVLGYLLRLPFALMPPQTVMPILQGRLRGYSWIVGAGPHGLWLGSYESAKQKRLVPLITAGSVCFDIGANAGFYSLLLSACAGATGRIHAFEPLAENLDYLERHVRMNRASNISIHPLSVAATSGVARFTRTESRYTSHLANDGELEGKTVSLDDFVFIHHQPAPQLIKIDVEGGELDVLMGARRLLREVAPTIFLATHGPQVHAGCLKLLISYGYRCEGLEHEPPESTDELVCLAPPR